MYFQMDVGVGTFKVVSASTSLSTLYLYYTVPVMYLCYTYIVGLFLLDL